VGSQSRFKVFVAAFVNPLKPQARAEISEMSTTTFPNHHLSSEDVRVAQTIVKILSDADQTFAKTAAELVDMCATVQQLEWILDGFWRTPNARVAYQEFALCLVDYFAFPKTDEGGHYVLRPDTLVIPLNSMPDSALNCLLRWL
jgi:hypothetical protein